MPIINIPLVEGYSIETQQRMLLAMTDVIKSTLEVLRDSIRVYVHEVGLKLFYVGGTPKQSDKGSI